MITQLKLQHVLFIMKLNSNVNYSVKMKFVSGLEVNKLSLY